jgi:hypothetical protein
MQNVKMVVGIHCEGKPKGQASASGQEKSTIHVKIPEHAPIVPF